MKTFRLGFIGKPYARAVALNDGAADSNKQTFNIRPIDRSGYRLLEDRGKRFPMLAIHAITLMLASNYCKHRQHHLAGAAFKYAAIASRSLAGSLAMFFCTSTIEPPTESKSGVKPVSR